MQKKNQLKFLTSFAVSTSVLVGAPFMAAANEATEDKLTYTGLYAGVDYAAIFEAANSQLPAIGSPIDFAEGMVGSVLNQPATTGHGSFGIRQNMLWLTPGSDAIAGIGLPAVGGAHNLMNWELPLNSGEWNIGDNDLLEFNFDWKPESTRPGAHSFDISFMDGTDRVLTLESRGQNTSLNSGATIWYYTGNHIFAGNNPNAAPGGTNEPIEGGRHSVFTVPMRNAEGVRTNTVLNVSVSVNLALQEAYIRISGHGNGYASQTIALPSGNLTGLQFAASRAVGNGWNRQNGWSLDHEAEFGTGLGNIRISGTTYEGEVTERFPSSIVVTGNNLRQLEFGAGADETLFSTTATAFVNPKNANDRTVTWSAYPTGVVSIVQTGNEVVVNAIGEGQATITATANGNADIASSFQVNVAYVPPIGEPVPDWNSLFPLLNAGNYEDWIFNFGSNFPINDFWGFTGSTGTGTGAFRNSVAELDANGNPVNHFLYWHVVGQSGGRNIQRNLPETLQGSSAFVTFDWRPGEVGNRNAANHEDQNVYDIRIVDSSNIPVLSLRMGRTDVNSANNRAVGAFAGAPTGRNMYKFAQDDFALFDTLMGLENWHNRWYTVGIKVDFDSQQATVSVTERGNNVVLESHNIAINATELASFELQGHRTAANNLVFTGNGLDNLFFFSQEHSEDTVTGVVPPSFLGTPPVPENSGPLAHLWQNWFIRRYSEETPTAEAIGLPDTLDVTVASGETVNVAVEWHVEEIPWYRIGEDIPYAWNPERTGVYTFAATIIDNDEAVNRMGVTPRIFVENRLAEPLTTAPRSAEWLDRGVVVVPAVTGGNLVQWRILATEYQSELTFNVFRNESTTPLNSLPISTLNFVDSEGAAGDTYRVEVIQTGELSPAVEALAENFMQIPLQRPQARPNPAVAFGAPADTPDISYSVNDMSVADVNGDGIYEVLVKWTPSQSQDPGLAARHTGETIFDLYTLEGELLWRINMGINITSSAHHSPFSFYNMTQGESAQFAIRTADGTRVFHPDPVTGLIDDTVDKPVYVIGGETYTALLDFSRGFFVGNVESHPDNVWVGGTTNPVTGLANTNATGRMNNGPEFFTVFDGLTGLPIDSIEYFAPYGIRRGTWGDNNNNRSDRFLGGLAYMPKGGVDGAAPFPTIIEGRQHYGPHHVAAMQLIDGELVKIWDFDFRDWGSGAHQGNHSISVHDVNGDGYDDVLFGQKTLNHRGEVLWSSTGTRGTINQGHGDALHATRMFPDSDEVYVFSPHEAPAPNNVTLKNAATGRPIWTHDTPMPDVGRGVAGNVTPLPGFEVWASNTPVHNIVTGEMISISNSAEMGYGGGNIPVNHLIYWTGSLYRQFLDGRPNQPLNVTGLRNFDAESNSAEHYLIQSLAGTTSNNGTKANPGLQADILGDWREEILVGTTDHNALRIYITNFPTDNVLYTLMHDPAYRLAINWQNNVYNQPPHLSFYLGHAVQNQVSQRLLPVPNIFLTNMPAEPDKQPEQRPETWAPGTFDTGDRVYWQGRVFEAQWWTNAEPNPNNPWGAWMEIGDDVTIDGTTAPTWTSSRVFNAGDLVAYNSHLWRAQWWTRNQSPTTPWGPWVRVTE